MSTHRSRIGTKSSSLFQDDIIITPPRKLKYDISKKKTKINAQLSKSNPESNCNKKFGQNSNLDDSIEILKENQIDSSDLACQRVNVKMRWRYQIYRINTQKVHTF